MNFYKHHLGDYDGATAHLTWIEDMAYTRLLRTYYRREKGFADTAEAFRLVRALAKVERDAVSTVLAEFFSQESDGWHNGRADEEIAAYNEGAEDREQKERHEAERMRRYRERRKQIFTTLRERGIIPKWDASIEELQRLFDSTKNAPATALQRVQVPYCNAPATANQIPEPEPVNHKPTATANAKLSTAPPIPTEPDPPPLPPSLEKESRAETIAVRLRKLEKTRGKTCGIYASDTRVKRWVDAGVTDPMLREAYELAVTDRERNKDSHAINAGFLDVFVAKLLNQPGAASAVVVKAWYETAPGIEKKGAELGIPPPEAETGGFPAFKSRVFAAAGLSPGAAAA